MYKGFRGMRISKLLWLIVILHIVTISGCALFKDSSQLSPKDETIDVLILSTPSINPDIFNRPSSVRLDLFQLLDIEDFTHTNYLDLIEENNSLNGKVKSKSQYILHPDSLKYISYEINKDTKYLGIIVGYQNIEGVKWQLPLIKQPKGWNGAENNFLYLKVDQWGVEQLSGDEMKAELKEYAKTHPDDEKVSKSGKFKKPKYDYSKGIFNEKEIL